MYVFVFVTLSALLLGLIKRCDPERHRSIYYRTKGRRE